MERTEQETKDCSLWPRDSLWGQFFLRGQTSGASVEGSQGTGVGDWAGPGRSWKEPEGKVLGGPQGRQRQFSRSLPLPSLQFLLTHKAFLRNGVPQKAQFETSDFRVFWSPDFSETDPFENLFKAVASHLNSVSIAHPLVLELKLFFWSLS